MRTRKYLARFGLGGLLLLLTLATGGSALAQPGFVGGAYANVSGEAFDDALSPYGDWVVVGRFGRVWRPYRTIVGIDFRPYLSGGHWVYTDYGWTFESDYEWGWAPFHYGRWMMDDYYGWVWAPDTVWGPAWVDWRFGGGYVGWVPLAPVGFSIGFGYQPAWCFVPVNHFVVRDIYHYALPVDRFHVAYSVTTPVRTPIHYAGVQWNAGPPPGQVSQVVGHPIQPVRIAPPPPGQVQAVRLGPPTGVATGVNASAGTVRASPPAGSAMRPVPPASSSFGKPSGIAPGSPAFGNHPAPPAPGSSSFGNHPSSVPAPGSAQFGNHPTPPAPGSSSFGNHPSSVPAPGSAQFGNHPTPPAPGSSSFGNHPSSVPAPGSPQFGNHPPPASMPASPQAVAPSGTSGKGFSAAPPSGEAHWGNSPSVGGTPQGGRRTDGSAPSQPATVSPPAAPARGFPASNGAPPHAAPPPAPPVGHPSSGGGEKQGFRLSINQVTQPAPQYRAPPARAYEFQGPPRPSAPSAYRSAPAPQSFATNRSPAEYRSAPAPQSFATNRSPAEFRSAPAPQSYASIRPPAAYHSAPPPPATYRSAPAPQAAYHSAPAPQSNAGFRSAPAGQSSGFHGSGGGRAHR